MSLYDLQLRAQIDKTLFYGKQIGQLEEMPTSGEREEWAIKLTDEIEKDEALHHFTKQQLLDELDVYVQQLFGNSEQFNKEKNNGLNKLRRDNNERVRTRDWR